jgi:hypothetical protein
VRVQRRAVEWLHGQELIDDAAVDKFDLEHLTPPSPETGKTVDLCAALGG